MESKNKYIKDKCLYCLFGLLLIYLMINMKKNKIDLNNVKSKISNFDTLNVIGFIFYFISINKDDKNYIFLSFSLLFFIIAFSFILMAVYAVFKHKTKIENKKIIPIGLRLISILFCVISLSYILFLKQQ